MALSEGRATREPARIMGGSGLWGAADRAGSGPRIPDPDSQARSGLGVGYVGSDSGAGGGGVCSVRAASAFDSASDRS